MTYRKKEGGWASKKPNLVACSGLDRTRTGAGALSFALRSTSDWIATIVFAGCNAVEIAMTAGTIYVHEEQFLDFLNSVASQLSI